MIDGGAGRDRIDTGDGNDLLATGSGGIGQALRRRR